MTNYYKRGDIFLANLDPVIGSEQGGIRPLLCIQNDVGNKHSHTLIVAAITSSKNKVLPTHVSLPNVDFLEDNSVLLMEQLRTIDINRIVKYIGSLTQGIMKLADHALAISIGIDKRKRNELIMTLCHTCANNFFESPHYNIYRTDHTQIEKEPCTFCSRGIGFEFEIYF